MKVLKGPWLHRGVNKEVCQTYEWHRYSISAQVMMYFDQMKFSIETAATGVAGQDENEEVCESSVHL